MRVLDLFSGIGGFSLGLERAGMETVAFCERDAYCQAVLRKHWPEVPCFDDIHTLDAERLGRLGRIDVVCGGFPCQPFSVAGQQKGKDDDRHLWPEMRRVIAQARPAWVIGENVAGIISVALDEVLLDLESLGYTARAFVIPACAVGASHQRDRVWIVANADGQGSQERFMHPEIPGEAGRHDYGENASLDPWRTSEPALVRAFHGIPGRVDRIRSLGNAVVPQIPEIIGRAIMRTQHTY